VNVIATARAFNQRASSQHWQQACDPTLAFTDPYYSELLGIWRTKAGDRKMPTRSQMTARDLKNYLRHIVLMQREEKNPSRYRWRLIGTSVTEIVGHNTGKLFEDSIPTEFLPRWTESFDMILDSEQPWRFLGRVKLQGREYLKAEHLYMPLTDDNGFPSFVMGLCRYVPRYQDNDEFSEDEAFSLPGALL
jgi:hypothetical protein